MPIKCLILRNCYVDRYYEKGEVYEVANALVKEHPKNFREFGVSEDEDEEALNLEHELERSKPPVKVPVGSVWCPEHLILHRLTTKIGKRCKKKHNL